MSLGNTKSNGNKGNNYPFQKANLKFLEKISQGSAAPGVQKIPGLIRSSSTGSIPAGTFSATFYNGGATNATVLGAALKPGEQVTFGDPDGIGVINYDATGTDLLIATTS